MPPEPVISLFCDEATPDPARQIALMQDMGIAHIDLRSAWNTDVPDMDDERVGELAKMFAEARMRVVCLATRIGKKTPLHDVQRVDSALLRAFVLAELFDVTLVRVFGFAAGPEDAADAATLRRAADRLGEMAHAARGRGFTLVLECERGLVVDGPEKAFEVLRTIDSPALRFIWDAGNMVDMGITSPTDRWLERLAPYTGHVHVKDAVLGSPKTCFAGAGDGQIPELAAALCARGYAGAFSLEPNVPRLAEFDGDREKAVRGAVQALRAILPKLEAGCTS